MNSTPRARLDRVAEGEDRSDVPPNRQHTAVRTGKRISSVRRYQQRLENPVVFHQSVFLDSEFFLDSRNHDWRVVNQTHVLGDDLKLQMLDRRLNKMLTDLNVNLSSRSKFQAGFTLNKKLRGKQVVLDESIKDRIDEDALALAPSAWQLQVRMKTVSAALVVCYNKGVVPQDVVKAEPCAKLISWIDPKDIDPKDIDPNNDTVSLAGRLRKQYDGLFQRSRYEILNDPQTEGLKRICEKQRAFAKKERMLFHFNGHGVLKPGEDGNIWVYDRNYSNYMPLSVVALKSWVGYPAIYVFDCSGAGNLLPYLTNTKDRNVEEEERLQQQHSRTGAPPRHGGAAKREPKPHDCIVLLACGPHESLPLSPEFPADVFTACLTTPLKMALRWFVMTNRTSMDALGITVDMVSLVPGKQTDRKTPLGELHWIFTAITDTIAWTVLPRSLFHELFRQDVLVASLFRNFLFAKRLLRTVNCNPMSNPPLPTTWQHHLWQDWDMAVENCLTQLPKLVPGLTRGKEATQAPGIPEPLRGSETSRTFQRTRQTSRGEDGLASAREKQNRSNPAPPPYEYRSSDFFANQLTAFEVWLTYGENVRQRRVPEQLPIALQVVLSSNHRQRALDLLARFVNLGSWAVTMSLSVGIFPYLQKLLVNSDDRIRPVLIFIWAKIFILDKGTQVDLIKDYVESPNPRSSSASQQSSRTKTDGGHYYFVKYLRWMRLPRDHELDQENQKRFMQQLCHASRAAFVLASVVDGYEVGQRLCLKPNVGAAPHSDRFCGMCERNDCVCQQLDIITITRRFLSLEARDTYSDALNVAISQVKQSICFFYAKLFERNPLGKRKAFEARLADSVLPLLNEEDSMVVQAAIFALSHMIGAQHESAPAQQSKEQLKQQQLAKARLQRGSVLHGRGQKSWQDQTYKLLSQGGGQTSQTQADERVRQMVAQTKPYDREIAVRLLRVVGHASPTVRRELVLALARLIVDPRHSTMVQLTVLEVNNLEEDIVDIEDALKHAEFQEALERKVGPGHDYYLSIWLAVKRLHVNEAFPAVSRAASFVTNFVYKGVLRRIEAIRERAGVRVDMARTNDAERTPRGPRSEFNASAASLVTEGSTNSMSASSFGQRRDRGHAPPNGFLQAEGGGESTHEHQDQDQQQQQQLQIVDDVIESLGLASTLYTRFVNDLSKMVRLDFEGVVAAREEITSGIDPLGPDGRSILAWQRRNMDAFEAGQVIQQYGTLWCTLSQHEDDTSESSATGNHKQPRLPGPLLSVRSVSGTPTFVNSNGAPGTVTTSSPDGRSPLGLSYDPLQIGSPEPKTVPPLSDAVQKRLENLISRGNSSLRLSPVDVMANHSNENPGEALNAVPWVTRKRAGVENLKLDKAKASQRTFEELGCVDHGQEMCSKVIFHPYEPTLVMVGRTDQIMAWQWPETKPRGTNQATPWLINSFSNDTSSSTKFVAALGTWRKEKGKPWPVNDGAHEQLESQSTSTSAQTGKANLGRALPVSELGGNQGMLTRSSMSSRVTTMAWMNETSEPLLLLGSDDGHVRIWRDVLVRPQEDHNDGVRLASAWSALPKLSKTKTEGPGLVANFHQNSGHLTCGGNLSYIAIWDVGVERQIGTVETENSSSTTCITSYGQVVGLGGHGVNPEIDYGYQCFAAGGDGGQLFIAGSEDGTLRIFDKRIQYGGSAAASVAFSKHHRACILNIHIPLSQGGRKIVSGSVSGKVRTWDIRRFTTENAGLSRELGIYHDNLARGVPSESNPKPLQRSLEPALLQVRRLTMTAFVGHHFCPLYAGGSHHKCIQVFNSAGDDISTIRYRAGFLGQRIGSISALAFHPYKMLLAAGSIDSLVSVYKAA